MSETVNEKVQVAVVEPGGCGWPGACSRPAAAKRGTRGPAPMYCEEADKPGGTVHNALNAWRFLQRQGRSGPDVLDEESDRAPVTTALVTADNALQRGKQLHAAWAETQEQFTEALRIAGDPDAAAAQVAAAIADAEESAAGARAGAARASAARLVAESEAAEARAAATAMAEQAEEAELARAAEAEVARLARVAEAEAVTRAAQARGEVDAAQLALTEAREALQQANEQVSQQADELRAGERAAQDLTAQAAAAAARADEAEKSLAAARRSVADVEGELRTARTRIETLTTERERVHEEFTQVRIELAATAAQLLAAQDAAKTAERTTTERLAEVHDVYERSLRDLRERLQAAEHAERPARGRTTTTPPKG
jgi:chromosome segregation ATPase